MKTLAQIIIAFPVAYLVVASLYQLILAIASTFKSARVVVKEEGLSKFLILVPAYKEDQVIQQTVKLNLQHRYEYPKEHFDLIVIADQLQQETHTALEQMGAKVHAVSFDKSTKVKSLQSAMNHYKNGYDAVVVLDADNVMERGFLFKANRLMKSGLRAVQGLRKAANSNTSTALMDGLSETANTAMLCQGANNLGLSSKLSGSAMVFDYSLFDTVIAQCKAIGGFDKEMELILTKGGEFIHYSEQISVLDQKVSSTEAFTRQRGRWLEAQYTYFKRSIRESMVQLAKGNFDFFHKVMQLALPPRAVAPFAITLFALTGLLLKSQVLFVASTGALLALIIAYLLVLPTQALLRESFRIAFSLPKIGWAAFKALLLMQKSKKEFIHTEHQILEL